MNINLLNSSADEDAGTRVAGREKVASIEKSNGLATLEKEIQISVSNKSPPLGFLNSTYMYYLPCIIHIGNC